MRYLVFYAVDMLLWSAALILMLVLVAHISGHRPTKAQAFWKLVLALYLAAVYNVAGASLSLSPPEHQSHPPLGHYQRRFGLSH